MIITAAIVRRQVDLVHARSRAALRAHLRVRGLTRLAAHARARTDGPGASPVRLIPSEAATRADGGVTGSRVVDALLARRGVEVGDATLRRLVARMGALGVDRSRPATASRARPQTPRGTGIEPEW